MGKCQICWNADSTSDVILGAKGSKGITKQQKTGACCSHGSKGTAGLGYDCIMIPGAMTKNGVIIKGVCQAGSRLNMFLHSVN